MSEFVSHLESPIDGTRFPSGEVHTMHEGRPLLVRYDLDGIRNAVSRDDLVGRETTMWRYRELLPVQPESIVTLGEGLSPLLPCPRLAAHFDLKRLSIKDESQLPTGSFKSRGLAMAVSMAKQLGLERLAIPTAGNAGGALAAYAARAGMECWVFMPEDTPVVNRAESQLFGARTFLVNGLITDCAKIVREGAARMGWFDCSTLKEPYRLEGKKTMGLELAQQLDWRLPNHILYPTGGGTGLVGMHKAFDELRSLGWIAPDATAHLHSCQSTGCAPIVAAFEAGARFAEPAPDPATVAMGLRVPQAVGDFLILDAVRESGGTAIAADESRLIEWMTLATRLEGISVCPETAACIGALEHLVAEGRIRADEEVVIFNTGAAQKSVELIERELPALDHNDIDWHLIDR